MLAPGRKQVTKESGKTPKVQGQTVIELWLLAIGIYNLLIITSPHYLINDSTYYSFFLFFLLDQKEAKNQGC
jgi:hypothetical protein